MRIASPPTTHSCFYGVDTPERGELLAARHDVEEMMRLIGVDSLAYLTLDGLYRALGERGRDEGAPRYCDACFFRPLPDPAGRPPGRGHRHPALAARGDPLSGVAAEA